MQSRNTCLKSESVAANPPAQPSGSLPSKTENLAAVQENETWKPLPEYEGLYEVSDHGRVRSIACYKHGRIWKRATPLIRSLFPFRGYQHVSLPGGHTGKKCCRPVHRLVLIAFCGAPPPDTECGHRDGNGSNNHINNLRWVTKEENMRDRDRHGTTARGKRNFLYGKGHLITGEKHPRSVLTEETVRLVRDEVANKRSTIAALSRQLSVSESAIRHAIRRNTWKHIP